MLIPSANMYTTAASHSLPDVARVELFLSDDVLLIQPVLGEARDDGDRVQHHDRREPTLSPGGAAGEGFVALGLHREIVSERSRVYLFVAGVRLTR